MKYSEVIGKNYFEMPCFFPGRKLVYFLDFINNETSQAGRLLVNQEVKFRVKEALQFDNFYLVGAYIKSADMQIFDECMQKLENTAPLFCSGYTEARIKVLDDIVCIEEKK